MLFNPLYILIKFLVYATWCRVGLGFFDVERTGKTAWALTFGFLRLVLGFGFGLSIWLLGTLTMIGVYEISGGESFSVAAVVTYAVAYVPVRWVEWSIMEFVMRSSSRTWMKFMFGADRHSRFWRIGGVLLSCAADVPVIVSYGGLPLGRFTC